MNPGVFVGDLRDIKGIRIGLGESVEKGSEVGEGMNGFEVAVGF